MAEQAEQKTADQGGQPPLPPDSMIILPVRQTVLFPGIVLPLAIGRKSSVAPAQQAVRGEPMVGLLLQTHPPAREPTREHVPRVGPVPPTLPSPPAPPGTP